MTNDLELVNKVKLENDSTALKELVERHSGIYINTINSYSYLRNLDRRDLIDQKMTNIYDAVLSFEPDRHTKFGTFVGQFTKWTCLELLTKNRSDKAYQEIDEKIEDKNLSINFNEETSYIANRVKNSEDERFKEIFKMRHSEGKKKTWREIGEKLGVSHECARKIYNKKLKTFTKQIS